MTLSRDPAKQREWQDRSRARQMAKPRKVPTDHRRQGQGIKPRSAKREREYTIRRELVRKVLTERGWCEARVACRRGRSTDLHEPLLRSRGGSITAEDEVLALCRDCHSWVHEHPADATALGLMIPSWEASRVVATVAAVRAGTFAPPDLTGTG